MDKSENPQKAPISPAMPGVASGGVFGFAGLAMLHPNQMSAQNEIIGAGICDFCGEQSPALKVFNRAPVAGACYCRKCAPLSETDSDWPNLPAMASADEKAPPKESTL